MSFLLAALISVSSAGWWSDFCEKHLIADDPYQFEEAPREWLEREAYKLKTREAIGRATTRELKLLKIIEQELGRRGPA